MGVDQVGGSLRQVEGVEARTMFEQMKPGLVQSLGAELAAQLFALVEADLGMRVFLMGDEVQVYLPNLDFDGKVETRWKKVVDAEKLLIEMSKSGLMVDQATFIVKKPAVLAEPDLEEVTGIPEDAILSAHLADRVDEVLDARAQA